MSLGFITVALAGSLLAGCREPASGEPDVLAEACEITEPTRLVAVPPGFVADPEAWYGLYVFGDHILFTFDRFDDPDRVYWRFDRCTGELAPFSSLAPGLHNPFAITTADGPVVYANDGLGKKYVVDRLDVAGDDQARPVKGLPEQLGGFPATGLSQSPFVLFSEPHPSDKGAYAAGIGGTTTTWYRHDGDPHVAAVEVGEFVLFQRIVGDDPHYYALRDDGELHRLDVLTGDSEPLLAGVRHFQALAQQNKIVWQELGDDLAETIYVHDFATGDDLAIAVNDFAQRSWFRDPEQGDLGSVQVGADGDLVAQPGPDRVLVTVVRTTDAETFAVPEHLRFIGFAGDQINLLTEDDAERALSLWDPVGGGVREWYRGPRVNVMLRRVDGDRVEYFQEDPGDTGTGTIWRVDRTTGEREQLLSRSNMVPLELADGRYFLFFNRKSLPGPPLSGSSFLAAVARDLKLFDPASGLYTAIADDVTAYGMVPAEGLVYLDSQGPAPGVWVHPLPLK
ncbi:hypothetical protein [Nannocystis punicea]|uniref:ELWxxDGT repeat-containing protein n=1 Tax=Nannocystis punicea TaxID=2995304 RepID=A0ABY7GZA2_9BACT|nr:hypothetical protein [Nannocystis poenicansa]WAS92338.1 hypothetical protein O0S08_39675 [Nannocystis poenicansa]